MRAFVPLSLLSLKKVARPVRAFLFMLDVFIGYCESEPVAYHVCAESLIRNSSKPLRITPVYEKHLKSKTPSHGYAPSNSFAFTRFLVPHLMGWRGKALWLDGDMVVLGDVAELFDESMDHLGVRVVKHNYKTRHPKKFLGQGNEDYPRKNWSSVILFNCGYYPNRRITPQNLHTFTGADLHRFTWLPEEAIGDLPKEWNVLADEDNQARHPKLIHYTAGTPCFPEYSGCEYSEIWHKYHKETNGYHRKD